jgi:hypothetical protein
MKFQTGLSRNDAVGIQRKDAKAQRRKGRKRKRLLDQNSPFGGSDFQAQNPLGVLASWRLCVEILTPNGMVAIKPWPGEDVDALGHAGDEPITPLQKGRLWR